MKVHYHGHSAISLTQGDHTLLIDPFLSGNPSATEKAENLSATTILLTHGHEDHVGDCIAIAKRTQSPIMAINELALILAESGVETIGCGMGGRVHHSWGWSKLVPAFHSSSLGGRYAGMPCGIIIDFAGTRIYNTGDTCVFSDMALIAELYQPTIMMLPVGGHYTMDIFEAKKAIEFVQPKIVIPLHYNTWPPLAVDIHAFQQDVEAQHRGLEVLILKVGDPTELPVSQVAKS